MTDLLQRWSAGDANALDRLMPQILDEARALARHALANERPDHSLQPTALVHEAYLRLVNRRSYSWHDRRQFFAALAELMRRVLVDHARRRGAHKRGGHDEKISLDHLLPDGALLAGERPAIAAGELLDLDRALDELDALDPDLRRVVMLRFFVGLKESEIARQLEISVNTVQRRWQTAKRWLKHRLGAHPN